MRKVFLSTLIVALLLGTSGLHHLRADSPGEPRPLAVLAFSDCDELLADVEYVAGLCDDHQVRLSL